MIDLGKKSGGCEVAAPSKEKVYYPTAFIPVPIKEMNDYKVGEEMTMTFVVEVVRIENGEYRKGIEVELKKCKVENEDANMRIDSKNKKTAMRKG